MLRLALEPSPTNTALYPPDHCWRVSSGSAAVLGLCDLRMDAAPTTAYLMLGGRCQRNCAFCTQARESHASAAALSRVMWPGFSADRVGDAVAQAYRDGRIVRACFQVTASPGYMEETERSVSALARLSDVPICACVVPRGRPDVAHLLSLGAARVTIALDAACARIYREVKGGSWKSICTLLEASAHLYPDRIGTHLIVGLGETEREMVERIQKLTTLGVSIGLFAFTPIAGTAMAHRPPPSLDQYRRIQIAHWLIRHELARAGDFSYDEKGTLLNYGLSADYLERVLGDGTAFRTSGCSGCNRPYYNERPGGVMYNYPRPLTCGEAAREIQALVRQMAC